MVDTELSSPSKVVSGIPQGTVLGPVLALIFLSDLDEGIENVASMFADDTRIMASIQEEADVEHMQEDLDCVYTWAENNNMKFNSDKFGLLRYGKNQELKDGTSYFPADDNIIEEKEVLRDLGIMMNNVATFDEHIEKVCKTVKQKSGWILRTFRCRQPHIMKILWKQLVQPHIDYCSQLYMPVDGRRLGDLENLQRHFTSRIPSVSSMDYWKRLSQLQMLSQQRRLERYHIIYVWKVIEGLVPNCGILAESKPRLGRMCNVPHLVKNSSSRIKTHVKTPSKYTDQNDSTRCQFM